MNQHIAGRDPEFSRRTRERVLKHLKIRVPLIISELLTGVRPLPDLSSVIALLGSYADIYLYPAGAKPSEQEQAVAMALAEGVAVSRYISASSSSSAIRSG